MTRIVPRAAHPTPKDPVLVKGKEKTEVKVFVTTTSTKGEACLYAHVKETSSPNPAAKAAGGARAPCTFFALGTCKFGDSRQDLHGGPD